MTDPDQIRLARKLFDDPPGRFRHMTQYSMIEFTTMEQLRSMFPTTVCDAETIVLFGEPVQMGIPCRSLDDVEEALREPGLIVPPRLRVLVVNTLLTAMAFGLVEVEASDLKFLRRLQASSFEVVNRHALKLKPRKW